MKFSGFFAVVFFASLVGPGQAWAQEQGQSQDSAQPQCVYEPSHAAIMSEETPGSVPISRGVNLSRWWEDKQDRAVSSKELDQIHDAGFDFVRLPISPSWVQIDDMDGQKKKLDALRCDVISILNADLRVVLDLHAPDSFQKFLSHDPNEAVPHIEDIWRRLQPVVAGLPPRRVMLSLYNEPLIESNLWWRIQGRIVEDLRHFYPENTFIVASGPFNGWWNLTDKKPYNDLNIVYDFHFYEPMIFTHHGANWLPDQKNKEPSPIVYPVNKDFPYNMNDPEIKKYVEEGWNHASISKIIDEVVLWKEYYQVRVACLEFGVYRAFVDEESLDNWLSDVRSSLGAAHIPWALWEYRGPFGLIDQPGGTMDQGMLNALQLKRRQGT